MTAKPGYKRKNQRQKKATSFSAKTAEPWFIVEKENKMSLCQSFYRGLLG